MKTFTRFRTKGRWREKLEKDQEPVVKKPPDKWIQRFGGDKMLIPTPLLVDETIREVPEGKLVTVSAIREHLARRFRADFTCPLTTGIFIRIVAETAEEDKVSGRKDITPWWRVINDDGTLKEKLPGYPALQEAYLQKEGFAIVPKGRSKQMVRAFEKHVLENLS